jgi:polysaccharide biosynthesis/export protein
MIFWILFSFSYVAALPVGRAADYTVQQGDVLEISVPGVPGLHRRTPVDAAGQVSLPLLGQVDAAGKSVSELRATLRDLLVAKNITRRPEVVIDIAEYRPLYIGGDVVKPGSYPYRPGMTVRDAIALAQGYDSLHLRGRDPMVEAANAQADYDSYAIEAAKQVVRIDRLKAALADRRELDLKNGPDFPVRPEAMAEIRRVESQRLSADSENRSRERAHLTEMLNGTKEQLATLTREREQSAAALDQQNKYLARVRELMQRGLLQNSRFEELQRGLITAQNQFYEMQTRVLQAQKDVADFTRKLDTVDDERRARLLQELQEAITQLETSRYRFEAAATKVKYTEGAISHWNDPAEAPKITIYENVNGGEQRRRASEAAPLNPGDNIEIVFKTKPNNAARTPGGS